MCTPPSGTLFETLVLAQLGLSEADLTDDDAEDDLADDRVIDCVDDGMTDDRADEVRGVDEVRGRDVVRGVEDTARGASARAARGEPAAAQDLSITIQ